MEGAKQILQAELEFMRQMLLHSNENRQQIIKKEEHIKVLRDRMADLDHKITLRRRALACN